MAKDTDSESFEDRYNSMSEDEKKELAAKMRDFWESDEFQSFLTFIDCWDNELQKPEYGGKSYSQLYDEAEKDNDGEPSADSLYMQSWNNAIKAATEIQTEQRKEPPAKFNDLPIIKYAKKNPGVELSLGKLSHVFFGPNAPAPKASDIDGQMSFIPLKYEKSGSSKEITLFYNYSYDDAIMDQMNLPKIIDDEDYFIVSFVYDNYRIKNYKISLTKLFRDLNGAEPNATQLKNLYKRLVKLATTSFFINDKEVREAWNLPYDENATYKEALRRVLPIDIDTERFIANGRIAECSITITGAPVIAQLSYDMGQYTTVPKSLIAVKKANGRSVNRTKRYWRVLHYLIRRIAAMKDNPNLSNKILYETFYADTGENTDKKQRAAKKTMYEILEHFRKENWITKYIEDETPSNGNLGVKIYWKK